MKGLRTVLSLENLQIFIYFYGCSKILITWPSNKLIWFIRIITTFIVSIIFYIFLLLFSIYYEIVNLILFLNHGKDYVGILDGQDTIWTIESETKSIINSLFILDAKNNEPVETLYDFAVEKYKNLSLTHPKMSCVRKKFLGYNYFLKMDLNINLFVKYMDDYKDLEDFTLLLDKYSNKDLPMKNEGLWEVLIGKTSIKWKRNYGYVQYPIFIRYHHSIGDGIAIVSLMTSNLIKGGVEIMKEKCNVYKTMLEKNKLKNKSKRSFWKDFFKKELYVNYVGLLSKKEFNILHGRKLSGEKHLCWILEDENAGYMEKVKRIKNRLEDVRFNDVIMAAFAASISEYYNKFDQSQPIDVRTAITFYVASSDFNKIISITNGEPICQLGNNFSLGVLKTPIIKKPGEGGLLQLLNTIKKNSNLLKNGLDFPFVYWQLKVASSVVPLPLLQYSVKANDNTFVLTNVPGNKTADILTGHTIRDTIIWAPNFLRTGVTFSVFTYDDLFRLGLLVDKVLIENREEVQTILRNIFKYIDVLDEETKIVNK